jgi:hypothetical protein
MNKYLIFIILGSLDSWKHFLDLILDKSVCQETCEYQGGRKLNKLAWDKKIGGIWPSGLGVIAV